MMAPPRNALQTLTIGGHKVECERIGFASSQREDVQRWTDVSFYRAVGGGYVSRVVARSLAEGENDLERLSGVESTAALAIVAMQREGKPLPHVARMAVEDACANDAAFAAEVGDSKIERRGRALFNEPALDGSLSVSLPRADGGSLEFTGRLIGLDDSSASGRDQWTEIALFAVDDGGYVAASYAVRIVDGSPSYVPDVGARAFYVTSAPAAMDALLIRGGLTASAYEAIARAAANDPAFAGELGDRHRRAYARWSLLVQEPKSPARHVHFSGVKIARDLNGGVVDVYRVWAADGVPPRYYVSTRKRGHAYGREADVFELARLRSLDGLILTLGKTNVLRSCAAHDRDVARAIGLASQATEPEDPLDATLPRNRLTDIPPTWPWAKPV